MRKYTLSLITVILAGCSASYEKASPAIDHPANSEANVAPAPSRSRGLALDSAEPVTAAPGKSPTDHNGEMHKTPDPKPGEKMSHEDVQAHGPPSSQASLYVCPMHPEVTSNTPGQRCPKCGMLLVAKGGGEP